MTIENRFNWIELLLTPLDSEIQSSAINDDNEDWEYIDGEMIKFGSLSHASLDIELIQSRALNLFATRTKDFRLLAHLLRTLQHAGCPAELVLAADMLAQFVHKLWSICYPTNPRLKIRIAQQILQRFERAQESFTRQATCAQRDNILGSFAHLAQKWQDNAPDLAQEMDVLSQKYKRIANSEVSSNLSTSETTATPNPDNTNKSDNNTTGSSSGSHTEHSATTCAANNIAMPEIKVETHNERGWKQTLLTVAQHLCEQSPDCATGYQLRRYAIWNTIQAVPMANNEGKTPLAAVTADRVTNYREKLSHPNDQLLAEIEQSLTLAPYWFEGHVLAFHVADKLGYHNVANAIHQAITLFLARLPQLETLYFADMSPFISKETQEWLSANQVQSTATNSIDSLSSSTEQQAILDCFTENGLNAALKMVETSLQQAIQPRERFYLQLLAASLFEQNGMLAFAQTQYQQLYQNALQLSLSDWEPVLLRQLTDKNASLQDLDLNRNTH